jgi:hypothetical protein
MLPPLLPIYTSPTCVTSAGMTHRLNTKLQWDRAAPSDKSRMPARLPGYKTSNLFLAGHCCLAALLCALLSRASGAGQRLAVESNHLLVVLDQSAPLSLGY